MPQTVDSYRFLGYATRKLVRAWIERESPREIPWKAPDKPLNECTVALVSSAALALAGDRPFDQVGERRDPWWGDPSFRTLPRTATERDVRAYHLHLDNGYVERDLNCAMPLARLLELERAGEIGQSAPSHYSFMGYILRPETLLDESTPAMIDSLRREQVDLVLLAPY